jgi:energy-coupling factor transporter ATP-binding protein EcfA2
MNALPLFQKLEVSNYGLYPGSPETQGLSIDFRKGLTLILGANGLGKTTLVTILYRMLTGPYDIPRLESSGDLGTARLRPTELSVRRRSLFSDRVRDGARNAECRLTWSVASTKVVVERRLTDLSLMHFTIDGIAQPPDELLYQAKINSLLNLPSFGDWILLLRHLVFYFEDRRALVWDATAQRQILRLLLLPPDLASQWTSDEREILELDSRVRNLNNALHRVEGDLATSESKIEVAADARHELTVLEKLQSHDIPLRERLSDELAELDAYRQTTRLASLKAEQVREDCLRKVERAKLVLIRAHFPNQSETASYIYAQLMSDDRCLVCGNHPPAAIKKELEERLNTLHCVVCDSDVTAADNLVVGTEFADASLATASVEFEQAKIEAVNAADRLSKAELQYEQNVTKISELNAAIAQRSASIDSLIRRLPPEEAALQDQRSELSALRARSAEMQQELDARRSNFQEFLEERNRELVIWSGRIKELFNTYAEGFLLESCELFWSPQRAKLGQTGESFDFPAFEIEMTGADFASPIRRSEPEQVSESQREFIDLAFRMALMAVASNSTGTTLLIDAPESSLDAVFSSRAAKVLARFALAPGNNRLILTSNLTEGKLVPTLLQTLGSSETDAIQVVDLFNIATPTAAIRQLRSEYDQVMKTILEYLNV